MQVKEDPARPLSFGATRSAYITFTVMFGGLIIFSLGVAVFGDSSFWQAAAILLVVYVFILLWLRAFRVTVTDYGVRVASLFRADKLFHWSEIASAEIRVGYSVRYGSRDALRSPFRLVILPKEGIGKSPLVINVKLLSLHDLQHLCDALEARLQVTKFDRPAFMKPKVPRSSAR